LVHGDDDRNVPFQQTTDLVVEKLRAQKVAFEELNLPRRNSRPAPLERLDPCLPRDR
jgi:dipeptidyl aminopeptidase/acylaminoacyl peptidase